MRTGRFAVKNGSEPLQEVLAGTNVTRDRAVANDLSMFGGLDEQKRLWIEHGLAVNPKLPLSRSKNSVGTSLEASSDPRSRRQSEGL